MQQHLQKVTSEKDSAENLLEQLKKVRVSLCLRLQTTIFDRLTRIYFGTETLPKDEMAFKTSHSLPHCSILFN